jgi:MoxR-like ATPase
MNLVDSTRNPEKYGLENLKKYLNFWASPRAGLALLKWAKVNALLEWRNFVIPEDIKKLALGVLGHRIVLSYEAIASNVDEKFIINEIIWNIKIV